MDLHSAHRHGELDGCPAYVRGWCCKARDRTLRRGYQDVGYLLAPRLRRFRPQRLDAAAWMQQLGQLRSLLNAGDDSAALRWFNDSYPRLMALIPAANRTEFVFGIRESRRL